MRQINVTAEQWEVHGKEIAAWLEGEDIETDHGRTGFWMDIFSNCRPRFDVDGKYRVKPPEKWGVYNLIDDCIVSGSLYSSKDDAIDLIDTSPKIERRKYKPFKIEIED